MLRGSGEVEQVTHARLRRCPDGGPRLRTPKTGLVNRTQLAT
jgi:hypothetical protein